MFILAFQDISFKILSTNTNLFLIFFFRSVMAVIIILLFLKFTNRPIVFKTHFPLLTLARCLLLFIGFSCFFISLSVLSYPIAITLFFASPLFVIILSKLILQENIGVRRWGAVLEKYPYPYVTMEIFPEDLVYIFDTAVYQPFYYFDDKKYTREDIKDESNAVLSDIEWNENFISLINYSNPNYSLDTINWVLKKGEIIYLCKKSIY